MIHKADQNYLLYHLCIFDVYYINVHSHTYSESKGTENDLNKQILSCNAHQTCCSSACSILHHLFSTCHPSVSHIAAASPPASCPRTESCRLKANLFKLCSSCCLTWGWTITTPHSWSTGRRAVKVEAQTCLASVSWLNHLASTMSQCTWLL